MDVIAFFQVIYIFIIPISLFYFRAISHRYRFHVLSLTSLFAIFIMLYEGWTLKELGIRTDNLVEMIVPYALATIIGLLFILTVSHLENKKITLHKRKYRHLYFWFIPISFVQEFMFRGFLTPKLMAIFDSVIIVIIVNALIFMYMHTVYSNNRLSLFLIFFAGIVFTFMYIIYPNLILISISHSILNFTVVLYGYFFEISSRKRKLSFKHLGPFNKASA